MKYGEVIYDTKEGELLIGHQVIGCNSYRKILEHPELCQGPYKLIKVVPDELFPFRCYYTDKEFIKGYFIREVIEEEQK